MQKIMSKGMLENIYVLFKKEENDESVEVDDEQFFSWKSMLKEKLPTFWESVEEAEATKRWWSRLLREE